ncbi:MAG: thiE [Spartobacteria bacterium]|nr:thiE [Spartobacteria bacterium]
MDESHITETVEAMIEGGVDLIQLRGKNRSIADLTDFAMTLHDLTAPASIPLIVNDHAEIARRVPVAGVHVGQDDDPVASVREKVGGPVWVGKSTHSLEQARAAVREGADYIGFGPIFATPTKPDYEPVGLNDIQRVHKDVTVPIFCIGGIKLENLEKIIAAGAERVVIVSGLLQAKDIAHYARTAKKLLVSNVP